jgi:hypothetical protein
LFAITFIEPPESFLAIGITFLIVWAQLIVLIVLSVLLSQHDQSSIHSEDIDDHVHSDEEQQPLLNEDNVSLSPHSSPPSTSPPQQQIVKDPAAHSIESSTEEAHRLVSRALETLDARVLSSSQVQDCFSMFQRHVLNTKVLLLLMMADFKFISTS